MAWSLEGQDQQVIARQERVYTLPLASDVSTQALVQTLSQVWGRVANDMLQGFLGK